MKLGRFPKPNAPLGNGGSFHGLKGNDGRKRPPASIALLPEAVVEDVADEVTKAFLLPVIGIEAELLLLVVKPWLGSAFCSRPCW